MLRRGRLSWLVIAAVAIASGCDRGGGGGEGSAGATSSAASGTSSASETTQASAMSADKGRELFKSKGCMGCHSLDGTKLVGPSFAGLYGKTETVITGGKEVTLSVDESYIRESIKDPNAKVVKGFVAGQMPTIPVTDDEVASLVAFIKNVPQTGVEVADAGPPPLSEQEWEHAKAIFFDRCAGCHGSLRKGATGPSLLPEKRTRKLGTEGLMTFIQHGSPKGMPAWGDSGILSEDEVNLMARYLQHDPPEPPMMHMSQIRASWKLYVKPEDRPTRPEHGRNWQNFMGVVLRDAGKVAIIDGDTKELLNIVDTGFAVHILRASATGRYFYSIGRDGRLTMIDLFMKKPDKVAEIKAATDARSVESSKYKGPKGDFLDKYVIVGGYWPPHMLILDGQTLEPLKLVSTSSFTYDTGEYVKEARVAAIVASHHDPLWVCNIKEAGQLWLVDYSDLSNLKISMIDAERFLHDGGWDASKRYVLMAANARNKIAVVDTVEKRLTALVEVGAVPHPGRGATFTHPKFGPVWATGHLGDPTVRLIGTDPEGHPEFAWKVVGSCTMPGDGGGNLFIKTHPKSKHLWADRALNPSAALHRSVFVFDRNTCELVKRFTLPDDVPGRMVHIEYNKAGDEVWVSGWSAKDKKSAILIFDDNALTLKKVITGDWLITPTGHWNVYNSMHDIY